MAEENAAGSGEPGTPGGENQPGTDGAGDTTFSVGDINLTRDQLVELVDNNWREALPKDLAEAGVFGKYDKFSDQAKGHHSVDAMMGSDERVAIPKAEDKDAWMKVYNKMGRPEESSGYDATVPAEAPEGFEGEGFQQGMGKLKEFIHGLGLSKAQGDAILKAEIDGQIAGMKAQNDSRTAVVDELVTSSKKEFGDKLPEVIKTRNNLINQYGDPETMKILQSDPVLNSSPAVLKLFDNIGKALGEDKIKRELPLNERPLTPKEAISKLNAMKDPKHPLQDRKDPRHKAAVEEYNQLLKYKNPEVYNRGR